MRGYAQVELPRLSTAPQRLHLELQNIHPEEQLLALWLDYGGVSQAEFYVMPGRRMYTLWLPGEWRPTSEVLTLQAETFQAVGDRRQLSVVVRSIELTPHGFGLSWWTLSAAGMLLQVLLLALLIQRVGWSRWLSIPLPLIIPLQWGLWGEHAYTLWAVLFAWGLVGCFIVVLCFHWMGRFFRFRHNDIVIQPWHRTDYLLVGGIVSIALGLRLWLVPHQVPILNGDDYLTGSFAANILLRGWQALYFGHHTGALSAYLLVPIMAVGGISHNTLLVLPLLLSMILTLALYGIGKDLAGSWAGASAALWVAVPSATLLWWTLKPQPGYLEAVTFAALALWGSIRLLWGEYDQRTTIALMSATTLAATLAFWAGMVVASVLLVCGLLALLRWQRLLRLPFLGYVCSLVIGLLWLIPTAIYVYTRPNDNPLWWIIGREKHGLAPSDAFVGFTTQLTPLILGIERPWPMGVLDFGAAIVIILTMILAVFFGFYIFIVNTVRGSIIPLSLSMTVVGLFIFSSFNTLLSDVRYVLPIYLALALFVALFVAAIRQNLGIWAATAGLGIILVSNIWSGPVGMFTIIPSSERPEARLAHTLVDQQITYVHTSYWIGQVLMVESGGQILASSMLGPNRESYDHRVEYAVLAADPTQTALVLNANGDLVKPLDFYLDQHNITCTKKHVNWFLIYCNCMPWPVIHDLQKYLPEK
ncbi:hypothetical protein CJ255_05705 [Candidatus Viridilinea mediisalina]|uniref:Glycosyltransferase RgtA/B/C/D-like domain-containing protein n=2 Tax=Candidatus Viridilinea mediisalina TaxID=2024553 RepID=A0A2A6RMC6_9CHLR|nr:hypothetical protein CJ255_05705 [Candidatus Viridilinea mediisalina]